MEFLIQDIKFGAKLLWKEKGFAVTAIATLALCIAANTAIFSVIHAVVFKPLPLPESGRILLMYNSYPNVGVKRASNGAADYYDRLRDLKVFEEQALYNSPSLTIGEKGSAQQVLGMNVTPSFFRLLRIKPRLGRIFTEEEGELGNHRKVILSYVLWQELYAGRESVIGEDLRIYGNPYTIVGIMPRGFLFLNPEVRLWRPLAFNPEQKQARHSNSWEMIGRLKPGATLEQARAQLDALNTANLELLPQMKSILINAGFHTEVVRLQDEVVRDIKRTLYLLWGGVLFVLLIGVVNIANLVLARSSVRMRELATRFALGAGRWRVTRQLVTESIALTAGSAIIGLLLGWWALRALSTLGFDQIPRGSEVAMNATVAGIILSLALLVGVAIGVIPVIHALKVDMSSVFRAEGRGGTSGRGARILRRALVVSQIAFALVLLVGAGLLVASFRRMLAINPGFAPQNLLTASVSLPSVRYKTETELRTFINRTLERIRALPGVLAAGATNSMPFGDDYSDSVILAEGYVAKPGESLISPNQIVVTPGYFETMRIPLREGRLFDERDAPDSPRVIIVDERLARKFWPGSSPIGRRMWRPSSPQDLIQPGKDVSWYTVIGVVGSVKLRALVDPDERIGVYYFPNNQAPQDGWTFAIRTGSEPGTAISAVRNVVTELDPELPLHDIRSMEERIRQSLITRRSPMLLAMGFGLVALFLSGVGIYGVLAYMVAQRTREIGIRIALGGSSQTIFKLIFQEGVVILAVGFTLGLAGTVALRKYLESVIFGVRPMDPVVLASVTGLLAAVAVIACVLPARRATRVDPITALRQE